MEHVVRLRWWGDDNWRLIGKTGLDVMRMHMRRDHSAAAQEGDVDGVMDRIAGSFPARKFGIDPSFKDLPTLEQRCDAFIKACVECGLMEMAAEHQHIEISFVDQFASIPVKGDGREWSNLCESNHLTDLDGMKRFRMTIKGSFCQGCADRIIWLKELK